ncbi:ABC transporter permease [Actinomadura madurae]|uniref:ABC transporter permease n=1 Tax=Actinomadura madurae TaxID=1993 RepID=UPI002026D139|nr:ABC transporter permease [Actinomadura madurae]MCP9967466.1 ABC transporter permease [Actinomadura madurae]URM96219.1 ABC transporter permease [Actinomadura madurae]URN06922.1 ABC transporter permease [Actinomadura madurae]
MSAATETVQVKKAANGKRRLRWPHYLLISSGLLVLLSLVRVIDDADPVTSSGTVSAALRLAVPIFLAGLGGLWSERSGVINIGLEGMMILGTWTGAWAGYQWGPWIGVLAGIIGGALGGLLHAIATVSFGVDHIVSGVAINILGLGLTQFLAGLIFDKGEAKALGGGPRQSPPVDSIQTLTLPVLSGGKIGGWQSPDWLGSLEDRHWFLLSDIAGILRGLTSDMSLLTLVSLLLVPLTFLVLWRTPFGLRVRSCGEDPYAAESLGVQVYRMKYAAVMISGGFAGLGGAFLVTVAAPFYQDGQTNGRGFIGLAAMIFGNWRPGGLTAGSLLFGYTDAMNVRGGGQAVHALLLFVAILLIGVAVWQAVRAGRLSSQAATDVAQRRDMRNAYIGSALSLVAAVALLAWFLLSDIVPGELVSFTPHLTTLLVLALASQRLRMPAANGFRYRRGEAR